MSFWNSPTRRLPQCTAVSLFVALLSVGVMFPAAGALAPKTTTSHSAVPMAVSVSPKEPEALAIGPNGDLYIADSGRDQILQRLPSGKFRVVAGTGERGFSGDGGLAVDAAIHLEYDAGIAVSKAGTIYFSDSWNNRVREVLPDGIIKTVAGGGTAQLGQGPVRALDASLASGLGSSTGVGGLTFGPGGDLYLAVLAGVYRLTPSDMLNRVVGASVDPIDFQGVDVNPAVQSDFTPAYRLAFDRAGDLYVAGGGGWGLYERMASGSLRFIENFRGDGAGFWGSLASDPNGSVVAVSNNGIQQSSLSGAMVALTTMSFRMVSELRLGTTTFEGGNGIAVAPNGDIYTDIDVGDTSSVSAILEVSPSGRVIDLWRS
jgi:hypothetical protein